MRAFFAAALLVLAPALALADAVSVSVVSPVLAGHGQPALALRIDAPIGGFALALTRSDGKRVTASGDGKPGTVRRVELPQPEGRFTYEGALTVKSRSGATSTLPLNFDAALLPPPKLSLDARDVDLAARRVRFSLSRAPAKAHVRVVMDTGAAVEDDAPLSGDAGAKVEASWPEAPGRVLTLSLTVTDTDGFYTGVELTPWQLDIPHDEVAFDTGRADVRADQEPKLEASLRLVADALAKYGRLASLTLFVAGHTDTVGAKDANRALSLERARSLGAWFRRHGLRAPILVEGFGEEAPLVPTPDQTAEPRNRRAEYIVAVERPVIRGTPFEPVWMPLK